ncbi:MAG: alpha/beta hydrolase [Mycobacterium sp.]
MTRATGWLGAGVLTAGVSAALLAGAGAATADTDDGSDTGASPTSAAADAGPATSSSPKRSRGPAAVGTDSQKRPSRSGAESTGGDATPGDRKDGRPSTSKRKSAHAGADDAPRSKVVTTEETTTSDSGAPSKVEVAQTRAAAVRPPSGAAEVATDETPPAATAGPIPIIGDIIGPFQPNYPPLVRAIGSAVFNFIGAIVQASDGPPVVPAELRDSIKVSSSTLVVSPGNEVAADWYFPTHGQPTRLVYLQHGILASSPMYSYTAAYLAERTNSVVVATTITSNPFAQGGLWLGGDNMHAAVAQLFLDDDREALNASLTTATLKVGVQSLTVPKEFVLVGHSLGGGFAPGVAGHYAEGLVARRADGAEAGNELAGVVLLDAVPFWPITPNSMERLKKLEESNDGAGDDYIPVYEIGAPRNFLNSLSSVNEELTDARPGKFNGVVINGGVHMDGMLGGNPLIQAAAYLVAGVPRAENPPAVQLLMAGWINDMFAGDIDPVTGHCLGKYCEGVYGAPGTTVDLPSDTGSPSAVVIDSGALPAATRLPAARFRSVPIAV